MDIYQERIKPLFDNSDKTNAEIERLLGITPKTINKWNSGVVKSYRKFIPQIASYFHVSTDYLLGNTDDPSPAGQKEKLPAQGGEPKILTPDNYRTFMRELSMEDLVALLSEATAEIKERTEK